MFKILILLSCLSLFNCEIKFEKRSNEYDLVRTKDLERALRNSLLRQEPLVLNELKLFPEYSQKFDIPINFINGEETTAIAYLDNEYFNDPSSRATFTISTFKRAPSPKPWGGKRDLQASKKFKSNFWGRSQISGSIFLSDQEELVIEPHDEENEKRASSGERAKRGDKKKGPKPTRPSGKKRDFLENNSMTRIYKRSIHQNRINSQKDFIRSQLENYESNIYKRANGPKDNYVELGVVVDLSMYNEIKKRLSSKGIKNDDPNVAKYVGSYFSQVINLANQIYQQSLAKTSDLKISVAPKSFHIANNIAASPYTSSANFIQVGGKSLDSAGKQYADSIKVLTQFNDWLLTLKYGKVLTSLADIYLLFTACNLYSPKTGSDDLGIANLKTACLVGKNGFLSEDNGFYDSDLTVAHEMAHVLGVQHDENIGCSNDDNYVMSTAYQPTNAQNSRFFSACSIKALKENIVTNNLFQCLANSVTPDTTPVYPGQLFSLDDQCVATNGPGYSFMYVKEKDLCASLYCIAEGAKSGTTHSGAAERSSCDNGKWCVNGVCTADPNAPKGECLFEADTNFCTTKEKERYDVCANWGSLYGKCCKYCKKTATVLQANIKTNLVNWFTKINAGNNNNFISSTPTLKCKDEDFCWYNIPEMKKTTPDICQKDVYLPDNKKTPIRYLCKNACDICV